MSPLAGLTKLRELTVGFNTITDISALSGLTNLPWLDARGNTITDISALSGLTSLHTLLLRQNTITDISALSGLTNLSWLMLQMNTITDISALSGLTRLELLDLRANPLSDASINDHIPAIESSGATVRFDSFRKSNYDIELVFPDHFTEQQKNILRHVARRWMAVIVEDLPDYEFVHGLSVSCGDQSYEIPAGERIDDLRVYVTTFQEGIAAWGGPSHVRETTYLPVLGCIGFNQKWGVSLELAHHEMGHALGFIASIWKEFGYFRDPPNGDRHFNGPLATAAFDDAGGWDYTGQKVPLETAERGAGSHWRLPVLFGDIMSSGASSGPAGAVLSAITVQSLADLGYDVDVSQADAYALPGATAGAKIAVSRPSVSGSGVDIERAGILSPRGPDPYGQGGIPDGPSSIPGGGRRTGRLERATQIWNGFTEFSGGDVTAYPGVPDVPEAKLTCGAELMKEPIYVVDRQGRIVRTIGD